MRAYINQFCIPPFIWQGWPTSSICLFRGKESTRVIKSTRPKHRKKAKNPLCKLVAKGSYLITSPHGSPLKPCAFVRSSLQIWTWTLKREMSELESPKRGIFKLFPPPLCCNFISGKQPGMFPPCQPHLAKKANKTHMPQSGFYPVLLLLPSCLMLTFFSTKQRLLIWLNEYKGIKNFLDEGKSIK